MNPIVSILEKHKLLILDGAFSTELERKGCDLNDPLWSAKVLMENPELIGEVHRDYFDAGADCTITASYQATYEGFMKRGLSAEEAEVLIKLSVEIAKKVRDDFWEVNKTESRPKPLVAASVGPYGAYLADGSEYRGNYDLDEQGLYDFHKKRFHTLVATNPDIMACETIPCLAEAKVLATLLEETPDTYGWISFSAKDGEHINSGERIEYCAKILDGFSHVAAIGVNCTALEHISSLIAEIRKGTDKPIIVYPNSGETYDPITKTWHGCCSNLSYGDSGKKWFEKGASIIGGCCRTTPEDIKQIVQWARG